MPNLLEYVDNMLKFLETEDSEITLPDLRFYYCSFVRWLIKPVPLAQRKNILPTSMRRRVFSMCASWTGRFAKCVGVTDRATLRNVKADECSSGNEHTFAALRTVACILCSGPIFDSQLLASDESVLFRWLDAIWFSKDKKVLSSWFLVLKSS